jgi:hypothetical protein
MRKWLGVLICVSGLGCGKAAPSSTAASSSNASTRIPFSFAMQNSFQGRYVSNCHATYYFGLKLYSTTDENYSASDHTYSESENLFWEDSCQVTFGEGAEKGTFQFYDYQVSDVQHFGIGLTFPYGFFTPATNQVSNLLDSKQFCSRSDWLMGVPTPTIEHTSQEFHDLAATDTSMKTIIRTECSFNPPVTCVEVTLSRQ